MTSIPQSTIDELERLSAAATSGPWNAPDDGSKYGAVMVFSGETEVSDCSGSFRKIGKELCNANAALIAALRNNIDALLTALEAAQANERRYLWLRDRVYGISRTGGVILDV